ncbi:MULTISPECIES: pyridoxal phosphate-dependent aminotransferase [unclassified Acidiphilium]|uniref:pyridoxal phosphate-dependent aminotransferase n=1 Tax=unclassified Acidiphilium TaxID=2617493 RepID=UPI000BDBCA8C|nr:MULTISPECIES: pyridoxal phosphate-dependent aminotransferase [unclassified Acidiphilium]OYV54588.1 MAG: aspartate aminotransferase [Acidiphilium sp. 20-67-58]HQT60663.1 pyridoxal phosphate-dependent aminotransferase [Acidiphilium sp.]
MNPLSSRVTRTRPAATFATAALARSLRAAGHDVISLAIGEPDFPTPPHVIEAAHQAAIDGQTRYPPIVGTDALRGAVARKFARDQGLQVAPADVLITNGGKQAIFDAVMAVADEGDEVIIPTPCWSGYIQVVEFAGARPVFVPCPAESGFLLSAPALEASVGARSKLLLLSYPNNPSGAVADIGMLDGIADVLRKHPQLRVISDDIYEHLVFDGVYTTLAARAPDLADRILTMSGVSKSYAMTGWRLGFCTGPRDWLDGMTVVQGSSTAGVSTISQAAAVAALDGPQDILDERRLIYHRRSQKVFEMLAEAPGLSCSRPQGAFYAFPSVTGLLGRRTKGGRLLASDEDVAGAMLQESFVATVPGTAFAMPGHIRLSTAASDAVLEAACSRIVEFCKAVM